MYMSNYVTPITCSNLVRLGQAVPDLMGAVSLSAESQDAGAWAVLGLSCSRLSCHTGNYQAAGGDWSSS